MSVQPAGVPVPVLAVGASAGGVEALREFVAGIPPDSGLCVLVVLHLPPTAPSALPAILSRSTSLPVRVAREGEQLAPDTVLVASPNHHLLVLDGSVALSHGPQENGHRPSVDVLFRSASRALGSRVLAVVLSGSLDDGAAGAASVAARGGRVVVQDFDEALYDGMPRAAAAAVPTAFTAPAGGIGALAAQWVEGLPAVHPAPTEPDPLQAMEVSMAALDRRAVHAEDHPGDPAGFGCPDCAGALYQIDESGFRRYRCRVGHAWSAESLLARQTVAMEGALWMALRSLEEKAALNRDLARRAESSRQDTSAHRFTANAEEATHAAELVRRLIDTLDELAGDSRTRPALEETAHDAP